MPLQTYLTSMLAIKATGAHTKETSFYTPLNNLLNAAGHTLKPHVRCIMQLKNIGAGMPDSGLFTQDQFDKKAHSPKDISSPARGVVEIKGLAEAVDDTATGAQVDKYQVIKKWLSYREQDLLGRPLSSDEVREVTGMARRIAALVLLQQKLDANYHAVCAHSYTWADAGAAIK